MSFQTSAWEEEEVRSIFDHHWQETNTSIQRHVHGCQAIHKAVWLGLEANWGSLTSDPPVPPETSFLRAPQPSFVGIAIISCFADLAAAEHSNSHYFQWHGMKSKFFFSKVFFSKYYAADVDAWIWAHNFHKIKQLKFYLRQFKCICKTATGRVNRTIYGSVPLDLTIRRFHGASILGCHQKWELILEAGCQQSVPL